MATGRHQRHEKARGVPTSSRAAGFVAQGAVQGVNIKQRSNDKARKLGQTPGGFMDLVKGIRHDK